MPSATLAWLAAQRLDVAFRCTNCLNNKTMMIADLIAVHGEDMTLARLSRKLRCGCGHRGVAEVVDRHPPAMGVKGGWYGKSGGDRIEE